MHPFLLPYAYASVPQQAEQSLLIKPPPCLYMLAAEMQHMSVIFMHLKPF